MLNDPNVPEESKAQVQATLAKSQKEFERNKSFADPILNFVRKITDKQSLNVVQRLQKELLKIFQQP